MQVKFTPKRPISDRTDQEKEISFDWALFVLGFVVRIPCLAVHPNKDPYKRVSGVCQPNLAIPLSVTSGQNFHRNVIHELEGLTLLPLRPPDNINHPILRYDIIIPQAFPKGESWEGPFFLNYFYLDVDVRSGSIYFIQEKAFGSSKT